MYYTNEFYSRQNLLKHVPNPTEKTARNHAVQIVSIKRVIH